MTAIHTSNEVQVSSLGVRGLSSTAKRGKWAAMLVVSAISFVLGVLSTPLLALPLAQGMSQLTDKVSVFSAWRDENLLAKFNVVDWSKPEPEGADEIANNMQASAALRAQVLQEFQRATDGWARHHFRELLWVAPTPGLAATAHRWASDVQNPKARLNGFSLLLRLGRSEASQALVLDALFNEQDADVLTAVLPALARSDVPEPNLTGMVVARLHALTKHENSDLRHDAIQKLAEWDKARNVFPADVMRLLSDADVDVRIAAIGATSIAGLRTEPVKQRLLEMLGNPKENSEVRSAAKINLQDFNFSQDEYSAYRKVLQLEDSHRAGATSMERQR